jgi:hypothetical protein
MGDGLMVVGVSIEFMGIIRRNLTFLAGILELDPQSAPHSIWNVRE